MPGSSGMAIGGIVLFVRQRTDFQRRQEDTATNGRQPRVATPGTVAYPRRPDVNISENIPWALDIVYLTADSNLKKLADRSGGQLYRADSVASLPKAFAAIAAELRTQYLLGYYPTNKNDNPAYRKIQVKTTRKDIAIRTRRGYRPKNQGP
jgi:VWFA-related protein